MRPYPFPRSTLGTTTDSINRLPLWPTTLDNLTWPSSRSVSFGPCRRTRETGNSGHDFWREWTRAAWLLCHSEFTRSAQGTSRSGRRWISTAWMGCGWTEPAGSFSFTSSSDVEKAETSSDCVWCRPTISSPPVHELDLSDVSGFDLRWSGFNWSQSLINSYGQM